MYDKIRKTTQFMDNLTDSGKALFRCGLPVRYMDCAIDDLVFMDYSVGRERPKTVSAPKQHKWVRKFGTSIERTDYPNIIVACYSSPTDEAAFQCGGFLMERAWDRGLSVMCFSIHMLMSKEPIPKRDAYFIYGVNDGSVPDLDRKLSSFLRERDGSLRVLICTGDSGLTGPWDLLHKQFRIREDILLVLNDENDLNCGAIHKETKE